MTADAATGCPYSSMNTPITRCPDRHAAGVTRQSVVLNLIRDFVRR